MNKQDALDNLRLEIATRLIRMEKLFKRLNIPMDNVTLIARDSNNDNMFVCVTSENWEGLTKACALALNKNKEAA